MILSMNDYPRSITRADWRRIWSARRSMKRTEREIQRRSIDILTHETNLPPLIRDEIIYKITNPVLFAWPEP